MPTISVKNLLVLLRVHRRAQYLPEIFQQIQELGRGRTVHVVVQFDRPSAEVMGAVQRILDRHPPSISVTVCEAPQPVVSGAGQRWGESLRAIYAQRQGDEEAGMLWDDDLLYTPEALRELRAHLAFLDADRIDGHWLHVWGKGTHNARFPAHIAAALFRVLPGDDFSKVIVAHCPEKTARSKDAVLLKAKVLHYGYAEEAERARCWQSLKGAGKIDEHTLTLVRPPILEELPVGD